MYTPKVIPDLEISFHSYGDAAAVAEKMLENGYVVMVSREEGLYILNAIWVEEEANRNGVTFMPREDFDYYYRASWDDEEKGDELNPYTPGNPPREYKPDEERGVINTPWVE